MPELPEVERARRLVDERIVGAVNWSQNGRFLDGFRWDQTTSIGTTTAALTWDAPAGLTRVMG